MNKNSNGFTVIELLFIAIVISISSIFFFIQRRNLQIQSTDSARKTAINAMYYGLEEVFYSANKYYPRTISVDNLKSIDPALFTDSNGVKLGSPGSLYSYTPSNCIDEKCKSYTIKADLENEADFVKKNRN